MRLTLKKRTSKESLKYIVHIPLCAECHNAGILARGGRTVGDEQWCEPCDEAKGGMCELCLNSFSAEDLHHGEPNGYCCYDCAEVLEVSDAELWARYDRDDNEAHAETMAHMQAECFATERLIELMRAQVTAKAGAK